MPRACPYTDYGKTANDAYDPAACQWPSVRYTPGAVPVVAQGDQSNLAAERHASSTRTGTRSPFSRRPLPRLGDSPTATRSTASTSTSTAAKGVNTVARRDARRTRCPPARCGCGCSRTPRRSTAPTRWTSSSRCSGFVAHLNDVVRRGDDRLLRQPALHQLRARRAPATPSRRRQRLDGTPADRHREPGRDVPLRRQRRRRHPEPRPGPLHRQRVAPTGEKWYQTTTLEGNHDWDMWIAENETGFDTEQTVGGEPVPPVDMGYVPFNPAAGKRDSAPATPSAARSARPVTGSAGRSSTPTSAAPAASTCRTRGVAGANVRGPVKRADHHAVRPRQQRPDGLRRPGRRRRQVHHPERPGRQLPADRRGTTSRSYILDSFNVTVNPDRHDRRRRPEGPRRLVRRHPRHGLHRQQRQRQADPGEQGVPEFPLGVKYRDNSSLDAGQNAAHDRRTTAPTTSPRATRSPSGSSSSSSTPATRRPASPCRPTTSRQEKTYLGAGVDLNVLPIIGLSGRVDSGVQPYAGDENGGIAGTVTYDTTRNELDPADAVTEAYQPGIPGLTMHLYAPVECDPHDPATASARGRRPDGSVVQRGRRLRHSRRRRRCSRGWTATAPRRHGRPYTTETWDQPTGCDAAPVRRQTSTSGRPVGRDSRSRRRTTTAVRRGADVRLAGRAGRQDRRRQSRRSGRQRQLRRSARLVNGNYGFGDRRRATRSPVRRRSAEHARSPNGDFSSRSTSRRCTGSRSTSRPRRRTSTSSTATPGCRRRTSRSAQDAPVVAADRPARRPSRAAPSRRAASSRECAGANHTVARHGPALPRRRRQPVRGPAAAAVRRQARSPCGAASRWRRTSTCSPRSRCPTHFWGLTINDLGLSQDKTQAGYGEAQPLPNVPMGIYDWSGRLVDTVTTDWNGMYEALEPSTSSYNCPLPAGPCPGMYYFKGNDPGQPGHVNANYNPRFRTIGTRVPGLARALDGHRHGTHPGRRHRGRARVDPDQPGRLRGQRRRHDTATDGKATPDIMSVSTPYMNSSATTTADAAVASLPITRVTISGFGDQQTVTLATTRWSSATISSYDYIQLPTLTATGAASTSLPVDTFGQRLTTACSWGDQRDQPDAAHQPARATAATGSTPSRWNGTTPAKVNSTGRSAAAAPTTRPAGRVPLLADCDLGAPGRSPGTPSR